MKITAPFVLAALLWADLSTAALHGYGVCTNGKSGNKDDLNRAATQCACAKYRARDTGHNHWDKCPDCTWIGWSCYSQQWHIGGDEWEYYCKDMCGARGAWAE